MNWRPFNNICLSRPIRFQVWCSIPLLVLIMAFCGYCWAAEYGIVNANSREILASELGAAKTGLRIRRPSAVGTASINSEDFLPNNRGFSSTRVISADKLSDFDLPGQTVEIRAAAVLRRFEIAILIDRSGSMKEDDCPYGTTRWQWCQQQTVDLARLPSGLKNDRITVVPFNDHFEMWAGRSLQALEGLFRSTEPEGGTRLNEPLKAVLESHRSRSSFSQTRPLLVVVLTDGVPSDKERVFDTISDATRGMGPIQNLRIVFLQVGRDGHNFLAQVDNGLQEHGASSDVVDVRPFHDIERQGLKKVLVDLCSSQTARNN